MSSGISYVLAKIQMVTKHLAIFSSDFDSYVLAKIQMVTKPIPFWTQIVPSYVLAKIQMVTKQNTEKHIGNRQLCSSKNSDGNKTWRHKKRSPYRLCSSKNSDGNKTNSHHVNVGDWLCSSKNSDGNKTIRNKYHSFWSYVLAKIQMVTKLAITNYDDMIG